ncbi:DUF7519 family protein [Haloarchaeobius amylolyticus]|uniref:DUF7519 family protein n=1 Tax=Haloarchaeobius amylolyticus TaxID=1198296 RepID=UPI0022703E73|nr:hypothetical protein [Haloarchaeobius amylolyticus]
MSDYQFDDGPARLSSRLAVGIAVIAALVLGVLAGQGLEAVLGLFGAGAIAHGARRLDADQSRDRAEGSVAFVAGVVAIVVALSTFKQSFAVAVVMTCSLVAVAFVALEALVGIDDETIQTMGGTLSRSILVLIVAAIVAAAVHAKFFSTLAVLFVAALGSLVTAHPLVSFVALQLEALAVGLLLARSVAVLDEWLPDQRYDPRSTGLEQFGVSAHEVPRGVWAILGIELLAAAMPAGRALFDTALAMTYSFGSFVEAVLLSWVPHAVFGLAILLLSGIVLARTAQNLFVSWVGRQPPKSLAYSAGGVIASIGIGLVTAIPPVVRLVAGGFGEQSSFTLAFETYGMGATFLGIVAGALIVMLVVIPVVMFVLSFEYLPADSTGFALGAGLLLVATVASALSNALPIAVFVGMTGALLTWDLGLNATLVGHEVGQVAETRRGEVVHAAGAIGVGLLAIVVSVLAVQFLVPGTASIDLPRWRAVGALTLLLVSLVAFSRLASTGQAEG